jgi:hypothetical protein
MAKYATDFPSTASLNSSDIVQVVQLGADKKATMSTLLNYINSNSTAFVTNSAFATFQSGYNSHASSHILGGSNELDVAKTRVTNLTITTTPSASWTGSGNAAHLGAYLYAIDYRINSNETTLNDHSARHAEGAADEIAGLYLDATGFSPVRYTPVTWGVGTTTTSIGAHLAGIDSVLGGYSSQFTAISAELTSINSELDSIVGTPTIIQATTTNQAVTFTLSNQLKTISFPTTTISNGITNDTTSMIIETAGYYNVAYTVSILPSSASDVYKTYFSVNGVASSIVCNLSGGLQTISNTLVSNFNALDEVSIEILNSSNTSGLTVQEGNISVVKI